MPGMTTSENTASKPLPSATEPVQRLFGVGGPERCA